MSWTEQRVETLKKLWLDGLSGAQIAQQLGGVTRNAVIGKVHRLGLCGSTVHRTFCHPAPSAPARVPRQQSETPRARPVAAASAVRVEQTPPPPPAADVEVLALPAEHRADAGDGIRLMDRTFGQCAWALGETASGDSMCCGRDTGSRRASFCPVHSLGLYVATKPFKDGAFDYLGGRRRARRGEVSEEALFGLDGKVA